MNIGHILKVKKEEDSRIIKVENKEDIKFTYDMSFLDELNKTKGTKEKKYLDYSYEELKKIPYEEAIKYRSEIEKAYKKVATSMGLEKGLFSPFIDTKIKEIDKNFYDEYISNDILSNPHKKEDLIVDNLYTLCIIAGWNLEDVSKYIKDGDDKKGFYVNGIKIDMKNLLYTLLQNYENKEDKETLLEKIKEKS